MSKKKIMKIESAPPGDSSPQSPQGPRISRAWLLIPLFALLIGGAAYFACRKPIPPTVVKAGIVTSCQRPPQFLRGLGFGQSAALTTSDRFIPGLLLIEGERKYQHPSWKMAGSLAPITRDSKGNVFVGPAPWIDLVENLPQDQNKLYRVDTSDQQMREFADLPKKASPSSENPYGILGLGFDCETNSVYASSVFGSARQKEEGRIFQIGSESGAINASIEGIDAIGLCPFNSSKGKKLYFGLARKPEIWSIELNTDGAFSGEPRFEVSLEGLGPRGEDKSRRISFTPANEMLVFGIEFSFNLIAPTEKQETVYRFKYDAANDKWIFMPPPPQLVEN